MRIRNLALIAGLSLGSIETTGCIGVHMFSKPRISEAYSIRADKKSEFFVDYNRDGRVECYVIGPSSKSSGCSDLPDSKNPETRVYINKTELDKMYAQNSNLHTNFSVHAIFWNGTKDEVFPQKPIAMDKEFQEDIDRRYHSMITQ